MSIDEVEKIDFLTVDEDGNVFLTISDHLPWHSQEGQHLFKLQEKLNSYVRFIESGEMVEKFPQTRDRRIVISVVGKFALCPEAIKFFGLAQNSLQTAGYELRFKQPVLQ